MPVPKGYRRRDAWHRNLMSTYYAWRESWQSAAEYATMLYATELAEYVITNPQPTFKAYLTQGGQY